MHKLLARQLKRHKLPAQWIELGSLSLKDISDAYKDFDQEKIIIERSLELVSEELNERNSALKSQLLLLKETHDKLIDSLAVLSSIFDSTGEAIIAVDKVGTLLRCNQMARDIFNLAVEPEKAKVGFTLIKVLKHLKKPATFSRKLRDLKHKPLSDILGVMEFKNGKVFEFHSSAEIVEEQLYGRVWCFRNVTQVKENEMLIQHQAFHDALTDLPNRLLLQDRLKQEINFASRNSMLVAVLFIDLDYFKKINDTLGHQLGDELLIDVSRRIRSCLRETDTLSRLGGDEFVVVLGGIHSYKNAATTSQRIIENIQKYFKINNKKYYISCSIGISQYPNDDVSGTELIRKADLAMYHAKEQGRSHFQFFDDALERLAHYNLDLENNLRNALQEEQFEVFYQPKICLKNKNIKKLEALLRWRIDDKKMISPTEFIPLAERMGLIVPIGYWVIEAVCRQIKNWRTQGISDVVVAINLSAQQFSEDDFIEKVKRTLDKYQLQGNCLDWEITESILLEDLNKINELLTELKKLGSKISIDDFGTGYSSLQYLQRLSVDTLKIDRSFIVDLANSPTEESLVSGIILLAHNLKLSVVAEGVEEASMVDYLSQRNCDYIQGYYFYKPMDWKSMTDVFLKYDLNSKMLVE